MNTMTCRQFDEIVHRFVRMELLDVNAREEALDHAAGCSLCSARMLEAGALAEASEAAGAALRGQQAPANLETAMLTAFRSHHRRATLRRTFEWSAIGAVAALVLVFVWTSSSSWKGKSAPSLPKDVSSQSHAPMDAKAGAGSQPADALPVVDTEEINATTGDTLASENFVPLPYAEEIGPEDLGMVVRVQLTRASLTELGYPANETLSADDDLVIADVLVGEDGWPRAVKLVQ